MFLLTCDIGPFYFLSVPPPAMEDSGISTRIWEKDAQFHGKNIKSLMLSMGVSMEKINRQYHPNVKLDFQKKSTGDTFQTKVIHAFFRCACEYPAISTSI